MRENWIKSCGMVTAALLASATAVNAQYNEGFEALNAASPGGILTTGQGPFGGFVLPSGIDHKLYTYAGNPFGLPQNPVGGLNFNAGTRAGDNARAQLNNLNFFAGGNVWTISYDFAGTIDTAVGVGGAAFLGSFSTQPFPGAQTYIQLMDWHDRVTPTDYFAQYIAYNAAGAQTFFPAPGPEWEHLQQNNWYRLWTTFDLTTNLITEVSIVDLTTGQGATVDVTAVGMFLGAGGTPTGYRMFTGGADGNVTAWDNVNIIPAPGVLALLGLGGLVATRRRR